MTPDAPSAPFDRPWFCSRRWALPVAVILAIASLTGCGDDGGARSSAHAANPEAQPKPEREAFSRVVTLLPFAADQLLAMGVEPVAIAELRGDLPEAWAGIDTIALDHSAGPNLEQLIAATPDLVITSSVYAQFTPGIEQATGARVVQMDVDTVADVATHLTTLGELVGKPDAARARLESIESQLGEPAEQGDRPLSVLAVFGTPHAFYAFLPDSYLGNLVAHAGGSLITSDMETHGVFRGLAPLSMEAVMERDPDLLLVIFHGSEDAARAMLDRDPLWSGVKAVREQQVVFLEDDLYAMRPGSELPRAIADITRIIRDAQSGSSAEGATAP